MLFLVVFVQLPTMAAKMGMEVFNIDVHGLDGSKDGDEVIEITWGSSNKRQIEDSQICVVMVGLPARGKSLIAQKSRSSHVSWVSEELQLIPGNSRPLPEMALHQRQELQRRLLPPSRHPPALRRVLRRLQHQRRADAPRRRPNRCVRHAGVV